MAAFFNSWWGQQSQRQDQPRPHKRPLGLESLEVRQLMAADLAADFGVASRTVDTSPSPVLIAQASPTTATVRLINGDIHIEGTSTRDKFTVTSDSTHYIVEQTIKINQYTNTTEVWRFTKTQVTGGDVFFNGYAGNDEFTNMTFLRTTANGGDGDDTLRGGFGVDHLSGGNGRDQLFGNGANDLLDGGLGADYIEGGDGDDLIWAGTDFEANMVFGGNGHDRIYGSYGDDELNGGGGDDWIDGSYGSDYLYGNAGNDILIAGNDSLYNFLDGGAGNDYLYGSYGGDTLVGGSGEDWLYGGAGEDKLFGGLGGIDHLYGGIGNDLLYGDNGDRFHGEAGHDTFYIDYETSWAPSLYVPPLTIDAEPGEIVYEGTY